ncbi:uncharacterized protein LOC6523732 isoform X2 [Drosophila yakuba]|nr:uncharacterized protein LOC6523732 isoform X2 [Drosophila yakuba]XP_015046852.1 uncharacterized protein LOC6523732 isoform X2 [Drosophila yakuba]KRK04896.1 uncharacterized protein Dyak_GE14553, isoform D [Drosophila yakuba]KRK04899.1 uncharacterized protein Dyak_GE14553, isoform G [Drosophila yakuba]KRK04904.1 uncharacterized protein Dyak_GE14553, isoform L [Drosophila yakuba]
MMEQDTLVWNDTDVAVASQHILNSEVYDIAGGMQERSKELRLTVSWTQSKSQIQDSCQRRTMLACKRRLTTSKVHEDSHPPLLVAFPNCNTHREQQHKEEHKVQLYSGKPLSIKLYVPGSVESIPIIRHKTLKTTNKPAMHRKSKSKSKFQAFNNLTPLCSSSKSQPSAKQSSALVEAGIESKASPHFLGKKRIKNRNCFLSSPQTSPVRWKMMIPFPTFGATSFVTLLTLICMETVLLSTMSSCAKTFYMHWNTSNSIFRIDNTDHIIDVNKGNLAFEFDQVHIICPVYEPGTFENETEKYIIYNVSKVEYETCRITNADPRVIAICDKPQKLMFFTITFRPFTPQPGGLEFLPGNDYYFISTSSKDDLYRRIGGRCSTNNMKVVFKVCCGPENKNKTKAISNSKSGTDTRGAINVNLANNDDSHVNSQGNNIAIGTNIGINGGVIIGGPQSPGIPINPLSGNSNLNGIPTTINSNIDQFNRIPIQPNIIGNHVGTNAVGPAIVGGGGIILTPGHGHGNINMLQPGRGGINGAYPGHHHIQTGIRINNVPTQHSYPSHKGNANSNINGNDDHHHYNKHPNEVVKNEELTYNSGTATSDGLFFALWTWIFSTLSLSSIQSCHLRAYWINSSFLFSIFAILGIHYFVQSTFQTTLRYRPEMVKITATTKNGLFCQKADLFKYDR